MFGILSMNNNSYNGLCQRNADGIVCTMCTTGSACTDANGNAGVCATTTGVNLFCNTTGSVTPSTSPGTFSSYQTTTMANQPTSNCSSAGVVCITTQGYNGWCTSTSASSISCQMCLTGSPCHDARGVAGVCATHTGSDLYCDTSSTTTVTTAITEQTTESSLGSELVSTQTHLSTGSRIVFTCVLMLIVPCLYL